ncbi:hypothetical protein FB451DRAFT_443180 [Mycena latifolia]|nr:hypothetical protein FB451DRAFT_443180 [Mycena latifolia]
MLPAKAFAKSNSYPATSSASESTWNGEGHQLSFSNIARQDQLMGSPEFRQADSPSTPSSTYSSQQYPSPIPSHRHQASPIRRQLSHPPATGLYKCQDSWTCQHFRMPLSSHPAAKHPRTGALLTNCPCSPGIRRCFGTGSWISHVGVPRCTTCQVRTFCA